MPVLGLAVAFASLAAAGVVGGTLLRRTGTLSWMRREATNVVATRSGIRDQPAVWLVAHTDSKSQTIGMLARVASIALTAVFFVLFVASMVLQLAGLPESMGMPDSLLQIQSAVTSVLTAVAILPVALCFITNKSSGALDNATGVAAVLLAIEAVDINRNVGVLLASAEEIGLAGARSFVADRAAKGIAINCDTIDNSGRFICMTSDLKRADALAVAKAGVSVGENVKIRHMIRGILTDSIPFEKAGWSSCTLSRGNLETLARVHTSRDEPGRIDGAGVALAARLLAATVEELT